MKAEGLDLILLVAGFEVDYLETGFVGITLFAALRILPMAD